MKIILFGANGMLGSYIRSFFINRCQIISIRREDLDIAKTSQLEILNVLTPLIRNDDIIINAAGITKEKQSSIEEMIAVNSLFPHTLSMIKNRCGAEVIHITTNSVFNGNKGNYNENDLHDCIDEYGKSKSLGENHNLTNIRTSIIGENEKNKKSLLEWVKSNKDKTIDAYDNHSWNGVTCLELAYIIETIIVRKNYWNGVRHIFSPNIVSKYELISSINNIYDLNIKINKTEAKQNCYKNLSTIYNKIYTEKTIEEQLKELKGFPL